MKIDYGSNKIKKKLSNASEIKKAFGVNAKRVSQRIADIEASANLAVLMTIPAANCHPLKGSRKDEWALDISGNHRIIFILGHNPIPKTEDNSIVTVLITDIVIIDTEDYH